MIKKLMRLLMPFVNGAMWTIEGVKWFFFEIRCIAFLIIDIWHEAECHSLISTSYGCLESGQIAFMSLTILSWLKDFHQTKIYFNVETLKNCYSVKHRPVSSLNLWIPEVFIWSIWCYRYSWSLNGKFQFRMVHK